MGRPSRKSPTKIAALRAALAEGKSNRAAAKAAGIPVATAARWISDLPELRAKISAAPTREAKLEALCADLLAFQTQALEFIDVLWADVGELEAELGVTS